MNGKYWNELVIYGWHHALCAGYLNSKYMYAMMKVVYCEDVIAYAIISDKKFKKNKF